MDEGSGLEFKPHGLPQMTEAKLSHRHCRSLPLRDPVVQKHVYRIASRLYHSPDLSGMV
jgi:hypothetical protein